MFLVFLIIHCFCRTGTWDLAMEEKSEKTKVSEDAEKSRKRPEIVTTP